MRELIALPGARLFQYDPPDGPRCNLDQRKLNAYVKAYLGDDYSAKDFRTWGGTLLAAIELAQHDPPENPAEAKRRIAAVMRHVAKRLGNTPAVARSSYVSPAVVEQYLDGRTIDDFRPRHLRVVGARDLGLDTEEQATLSLLRSWRIRASRAAA
jgi:DNA topoisomerase-1